MKKRIFIFLRRLRERLWVKPLIFCIISVAGALLAQYVDQTSLHKYVPDINLESIEDLLDHMSASMLVISTFAVASMLSAFYSASQTATPRSFKLVITDDVSQNALSAFIGAFIFSIIASIALDNELYDKGGKFILFSLTLLFFAAVILTFLKWVDRISRLGQLEHTINQIEKVTSSALEDYLQNPHLKGVPFTEDILPYHVLSEMTAYAQHIDMEGLQDLAEKYQINIRLSCRPGDFVHQNMKIAEFSVKDASSEKLIMDKIKSKLHFGKTRQYDEDPLYGIISLTEIASRALSPGINDPGTAIQIIGSHERLFHLWNKTFSASTSNSTKYKRVEIPDISLKKFFNTAFLPISRDGAGLIEVMMRLQQALKSISTIDNASIKSLASWHSDYAIKYADHALTLEEDKEILRKTGKKTF